MKKDPHNETKFTRGLFPPINQQHAFLNKDPRALRGAGYDKKGHMQPGYVDSLYEDVRSSLQPYELRGFKKHDSEYLLEPRVSS